MGANDFLLGLGGMGGGPRRHQARGAHFDGTNDFMSSTSLTTADSDRLVVAAWFRNTGGDGVSRYLMAATSFRMYIQLTGGNVIRVVGRDSSNVQKFRADGAAYTSDRDWRHLFCYVDCRDGASFLAQDGADNGSINQQDVATINTGQSSWGVGANSIGNGKAAVDLAEVWIGDPGRAVTTADISSFITANGKPKRLGAQGQFPFGAQPMFYFAGGKSNFQINRGSAGDMTVTGALTDPERLYRAGA